MESEELESRPTGTVGLSASTVREKNESMVLPLVIVKSWSKTKRQGERERYKEVLQDKNKKQEEQNNQP